VALAGQRVWRDMRDPGCVAARKINGVCVGIPREPLRTRKATVGRHGRRFQTGRSFQGHMHADWPGWNRCYRNMLGGSNVPRYSCAGQTGWTPILSPPQHRRAEDRQAILKSPRRRLRCALNMPNAHLGGLKKKNSPAPGLGWVFPPPPPDDLFDLKELPKSC